MRGSPLDLHERWSAPGRRGLGAPHTPEPVAYAGWPESGLNENRRQAAEALARWRGKPKAKHRIGPWAEPISEARIREFLSATPRAEYVEVLRSDPCAYCTGQSETLDHIEPMARGGMARSLTNLIGACWRCNQEKAAMTLLMWLRWKAADPS